MSCQVYPQQYDQLLAEKVSHLQGLLPALPDLQVFASPKSHFRARIEFSIWHEGANSDYIMFDGATKQRIILKNCPMASQAIDELMPLLMAQIEAFDVLRNRLFEIDFLSTASGEMLVTLIYRRPIADDQAWLEAAKILKANLPITHLIGRARKQKIVLDQDYVIEKLQVDGRTFIYQQIENSFTQPNIEVAQAMLHWARKVSQGASGDLLELYCGNGNFSIALAEHYHRVLATEISRSSVASAQFNIAANQVENLTIIKMAAEEVVQALDGKAFYRLNEVDLTTYDFQTIFVDPPRSGLDDLTRQMVMRFERIIYISCNPETLAFDLQTILQTHELVESALFDQFPYTHHIESGVFLKRRGS